MSLVRCCGFGLLPPARYRPQLPDQLNYRRADRDKNYRGQNKYHQWGNHLDGGLCSLFFGPLPAFRAEGVGMHAEGLGDAGAEAISLNQCTNKRTDIVNPGAVYQITEGLGTGFTGPHLEVHKMELIAEIGVGMAQILAHTRQRLVKRKAGLDANDGEVEGIGQAEANAMLPVSDHALQDEARKKETEAGNTREEEHVIVGKPCDDRKARRSHQKTRAEIIINVDGITESGLNQPAARARN